MISPGFTYAGTVKSRAPVKESDVVVLSLSLLQEAASIKNRAAVAMSVVFLISIVSILFCYGIFSLQISLFFGKNPYICANTLPQLCLCEFSKVQSSFSPQ